MRGPPTTEHIPGEQVLPRYSGRASTLHSYVCDQLKLLQRSTSVKVTGTPLLVEFEARSDVLSANIFRMQGDNSPKECSRTCLEHADPVVASERPANCKIIASRRRADLLAPIYRTVILNPTSVLICLVCIICDTVAVSVGDAVPINYPRHSVKQPQGRQTMVLMPPFDLGFRGQTSNGVFPNSRMDSRNYYNSYWRPEGAQLYSDGHNVKPGPPMSLTSGYGYNYHSPESSGYRAPLQNSHLPPQHQPSHDLMQNDPVYMADEGVHHPSGMSKASLNYGQSPGGYGSAKPTFDRYNRWPPQDTVYTQTGGYTGNLYNRPDHQMSPWDQMEPPGYGPSNSWNSGYPYPPSWYDPAQMASSWQRAPFYDQPYQKQVDSHTADIAQGYGPAYGHPSNYGEVSEAELANRLAEYEENARKAGLLQEAGSSNRIAEDLQLPRLDLPDSAISPNGKKADKGIVISGSEAHDDVIRNFNRVAAGFVGPYGVETLFKEIDLNNDRVIDIKELKKFLQLHEIFVHH